MHKDGSTYAKKSMAYTTLTKEKLKKKPQYHLNRCKKAFDKVQYPFMIKTLTTVGIEGTHLNIIKAIYDKPTAKTILNGEKLKAFSLIWNKRGMPTLTTAL